MVAKNNMSVVLLHDDDQEFWFSSCSTTIWNGEISGVLERHSRMLEVDGKVNDFI